MTKRTPFLLIVALAAVVAACSGSPGAPAGDGGTVAGGAATTTGEPVEGSLISGAIAKLGSLPSFSYETQIGGRSVGRDFVTTITGVERPLDDSRSYYASALDGVTWTSMTVGGKYFTDIGRGLEPFEPRDDAARSTDPNWIANLLDGHDRLYDEFELVGDESIEGRAVKHLALGDYELERMLQTVKTPGMETFSFELWIDAADGYLVRAHYGRLPFATNGFSGLTEFRFELSDVGCDCPITEPTIAATPVPATLAPVATPVVAPAGLSCANGTTGADIEWAAGAQLPDPVDQITAWSGVLPTDVMAFDAKRIVLLRDDVAIAEWTFDLFGRSYQMQACTDAGIEPVPPVF